MFWVGLFSSMGRFIFGRVGIFLGSWLVFIWFVINFEIKVDEVNLLYLWFCRFVCEDRVECV